MQSVKNILEFREKSSAALGEGLNGYILFKKVLLFVTTSNILIPMRILQYIQLYLSNFPKTFANSQ